MFHEHDRRWQLGKVSSLSFETDEGTGWRSATDRRGRSRWKEEWNDRATESVQVLSDDGQRVLQWDRGVQGSSMPSYFWGTSLRAVVSGVPTAIAEPRNQEEGLQLWEREMRSTVDDIGQKTVGAAAVPAQAARETANLLGTLSKPVVLARDLDAKIGAGNLLERNMRSQAYQDREQALQASLGQKGSDMMSLADIAGQLAAADAGVWSYLSKNGLLDSSEPSEVDVCRAPTGADAIEEMRLMPPFLTRFLWAFSCNLYVPPGKARDTGGRLKARAGDDDALGKRAMGLIPVFAALFAGGGEWSDLTKLSLWGRGVAVRLLLGKGSIEEKTLNLLKKELQCISSPATARRDIEAAALQLRGPEVLTAGLPEEFRPREGEVPAICGTVDKVAANMK